MEKKMMKSNGVDSRSSAMKRRRLFSAAAVLLAVCLVFVGAAGADAVAKIEGKEGYYDSIQAAVNAAEDGDVIKVTESHNLSPDDVKTVSNENVLIAVDNNKDITIDLNGKMVTADFTTYTGNKIYSVIGVAKGAKLTMVDDPADKTQTGGLHVVTTDGSKNKVRVLLTNFDDSIYERGQNQYSLVIEGGAYTLDCGDTDNDAPGSIVYAYGSRTTLVKGGTFKIDNIGDGPNNCPWIFSTKKSNERKIVVEGGTFNDDINHQYWAHEVEVLENFAVSDNGDDTWTVVNAVAYVTEYSGNYPRNVGYTTLDKAVEVANSCTVAPHKNGQELDVEQREVITLLKDAELEDKLVFTKPTVFNMDGHKLIWKGGVYDDILTVSGNTLTIDSFNIIREGYTITKWKLDNQPYDTLPRPEDNGQVVVQTSLSIAEPEPNTYTVIFDKNGGKGTMANQEFTYDEEETLTLNAFTKTGYRFTGWKTNPNDSKSVYTDGQRVKNLTTINNGKVTLYANWTINQYTITFATDGGSTVESITQDYGTDVTAPADPTKDGYTFAGWDKEIPVTMPAENLEITAIWKEIPAEEEIITPPSSGGGGDGGALSFPRFTENGGLVDFGSSKVVKALMLPEGSRGSVLLKVDTVEKWPKAVETEYPFDISVEKLGEGVSYILFDIPVSTLDRLAITPADIGVYHLVDEVWVKLAVTYEVKDGMVCYEAETDSFSPFKLVIEEGAATQKEEENVPTVPPTEEPDVPDEPEILPPIDELTKPADEPETPAPILAVLAGLGAAFIVRRK